MDDERMTNTELARLLDLSHVTISRIRSGARHPGFPDAMARIEQVLGWSIADQAAARRDDVYAQKFEEAVARYASGRNTTVGPEESAPPAPQD